MAITPCLSPQGTKTVRPGSYTIDEDFWCHVLDAALPHPRTLGSYQSCVFVLSVGDAWEGSDVHLPAGMDCLPIQMRPFMKVPVVITVARHLKVMPKKVLTPLTSPLESRSRSTAIASLMARFGVLSRSDRISRAYSNLSVWALRDHTAGPCTFQITAVQVSGRGSLHTASAYCHWQALRHPDSVVKPTILCVVGLLEDLMYTSAFVVRVCTLLRLSILFCR